MSEVNKRFSDKKFLLMAGGTGGHVFPALAVAKALQEQGATVEWLGTQRGIESRLVPSANIPLHCIKVEGIRGKGKLALLKAPLQIIRAIAQARVVVKKVKPDAVLGFGGFATGPGGVAARLGGVPLIIHEQNAVAGTTNRLLARISNRVLEAFPCSLPGARQVGNPVRREIVELPEPEARIGSEASLRLLVLGGSLGAVAINELVPKAIALLEPALRPTVVHQAGERHLQIADEAYQKAGVKAEVVPFIANMAEAYSSADLIICRSGALTVSEIAAAGIGAVMVPYPYAIDDHQTRNGEWLQKAGGAIVMQQSAMDEKKLSELLQSLLSDRKKLLIMANAARQVAKIDATEQVISACGEELALAR
ncbi:undecaprenyldiphospho-muramoylpentapeptide beta-N-acetylglucosaminyltransferase [Microbulbifer sp. OS29]|uniref:UDP-N-acetylglucosamine--N-acetylmuramyl-(pentapeptide) pyrophosphoryl-undecaprenol N-acetylglucosamine transferase n=1 Tax=Microbulbifer okhotskensis TaxID=2926617 RepID=A0A9X2EL81_9GAMM|nr:undecaprenyldiphospho-muramoylpentapeptide beta-N-acetylglucosaminyltransferase [Microbulbifer okhotskensis]MCO1333684.1 undecaprenyldiphospho-muramoylpentapeptide beta-N-acetylglucosaminyltransferase [Microbulbifer okhotskensis]